MTRPALATSHRIEPVDPGEAPGLGEASRRFQTGELTLPTATPPWRALPGELPAPGQAWLDSDWGDELQRMHERLGAPPASMQNLMALRSGAATSVITGQQPGLLGGPLFCAYKIAGAVALARELSTRTSRRVVAVYWCGADDSDYEEVRRAWFWAQTGRPFRGELPERLWREGLRVGSVHGGEVARVEQAMLDHAGRAAGASELGDVMAGLGPDLDLGSRVMAMYLRLFADAGLVVVDARSRRLRDLGRPWFTRYARGHVELTASLVERTRELAAAGLATPLAEPAVQSGLFVVDGDVRRKLEPAELDTNLPKDLSPSVLLRPLWQDALLAPAAAVLGPSELAYHAQLAPLYDALDVVAAAPVARPHLTLLPPGLPWPAAGSARAALLAGGEAARTVLADAAMPPAWADALREGRDATERAWRKMESRLDPAARHAVEAWPQRARREWDRLRELLREPALARRATEQPAWEFAPHWLAVRGTPQERALAAATGWWRWGWRFTATLESLGEAYVQALATGAPSTFVGKEDA